MSTIKSAEPFLWHHANGQPYKESKFWTTNRDFTINPLFCQTKKEFVPDNILHAKIDKTFVLDNFGAPTKNRT